MKIPTTRSDPSIAVLEALKRMQAEWGLAPQRGRRASCTAPRLRPTPCWSARAPGRPDHHRGLPRRAGDRAPDAPPDVRAGARSRRRRPFWRPDACGARCRSGSARPARCCRPLDEAAVADAADALVAAGARAIAVVFLFSFLDDTHERRAREIILQRHPDVFVSLSSRGRPGVPRVRAHRRHRLRRLREAGGRPLSRQSRQRPAAAPRCRRRCRSCSRAAAFPDRATARLRPVRLFLSGPAAGVIGAKMVGEIAGMRDLITVDVGGTSCDIALIEDGTPALRSEGLIDGYPVRVGMVDVNSIGSGGGSIAWLDAAGGLRVGPQSAGSEPGPACYGRGGTEATVTDASVVLGYLDPDYFAGGKLKLKPELAREAMARIARPAQPHGRAGRARHPSHPQRPDGRRHPPRVDPAGPRPAPVHAAAARRRRRPACLRARRGTRHSRACSSRAIPACCRPPACWPRRSSTRSSTALPRRDDGVRSGGGQARLARQLDERCSALMNDEKVERGADLGALLRRRLLRRPGLSSGSAVRARTPPTRSAR